MSVGLFFKSINRIYLYDTGINDITPVSDEMYRYVSLGERPEDEQSLTLEYEELFNRGFLQGIKVEKFEHPYSKFIDVLPKRSMTSLCLQVTRSCNLACQYCSFVVGKDYYRKHENLNMSWETAKKAIDFFRENSIDSDFLDISFYGGEPLINMELIKKCVDYAKKILDGKNLSFRVTTNATLLKGEILDFLMDNDFSLTISMDGPESIHDKNRIYAGSGKGSFKTVLHNLKEASSKYPDRNFTINMVMDPTLDYIEYDRFITHDVKNIGNNIMAYPNIMSSKDNAVNVEASDDFGERIVYESFINLLCEFKLSEKGKGEYSLMDIMNSRKKSNTFLSNRGSKVFGEFSPSAQCIPGVKKLFVNCMGKFYPCEKVNENNPYMVIGDIDKGFDYEKIYNILNIGSLTYEKCKNCPAVRNCKVCVAELDCEGKFTEAARKIKCDEVISSVYNKMLCQALLSELPIYYSDVTGGGK